MSITSLLFGKRKTEDQELFLQNRAPIRTIPFHLEQVVQRKICGNHIYLEAGKGKPVIFCHGLFGGIYNIDIVCKEIAQEYRFIMPYLPMYDVSLLHCTIEDLGNYLESFIEDLRLEEAILIGSSTGGGAALFYAGKPFNKLKGMVLCGSSGLSTIPLSKGYFKRKDYAFVKEAVQDVFINKNIPCDDMVTDIFTALQSNELVIRSIRFTKSATQQRMHNHLPYIETPTLLVWGKQDPITPVEVAPQFQQLMPYAAIRLINKCGHLPTQEKPFHFLELFFDYLKTINY
ncbi:MAG TPA: alpha/beta hydrolase [Chitinophagaceae bacterium]